MLVNDVAKCLATRVRFEVAIEFLLLLLFGLDRYSTRAPYEISSPDVDDRFEYAFELPPFWQRLFEEPADDEDDDDEHESSSAMAEVVLKTFLRLRVFLSVLKNRPIMFFKKRGNVNFYLFKFCKL